MEFACERVVLEAQPALTMRWQTTFDQLPKVFDETFSTLYQYLTEIGETPVAPPFAIYHSIDGQNVDVELGAPIATAREGRDRILSSELPGGEVATCLVVGPYDLLPSAYEALMAWVQEQGYQLRAAPFEQYMNDPSSVPPEQYETRICMPIHSAA